MAAHRKPRRLEVPAPRTEVVEVFKTLGIDKRVERERLLTLGGYQERSDKPVYYAIRVTANLDATGSTAAIKIIENQDGNAFIQQMTVQQAQ